MAICKIEDGETRELQRTTFANERLNETRDLQKLVIQSIEIIEKGLLVISSEFGSWEDSRRRIDILCLDKNANLVVIELKRTDEGGHMELQALRYAAMISQMTFENAVEAYREYIEKQKLLIDDPKRAILDFLDWVEENENEFANDVRIILISADFSKEITTSVLWLIERDLDIKCVRIRPQKDGEKLYLDIQQVIPLPEAGEYQIKLREKAIEQRQARREGGRDYSKYDVTINGNSKRGQNKRQAILFVISQSVKSGISPIQLMSVTEKKAWYSVPREVASKEEFITFASREHGNFDPSRWFLNDDQIFVFEGKTYAFTNQHGKGTFDIIRKIFSQFSQLNGVVRVSGEE